MENLFLFLFIIIKNLNKLNFVLNDLRKFVFIFLHTEIGKLSIKNKHVESILFLSITAHLIMSRPRISDFLGNIPVTGRSITFWRKKFLIWMWDENINTRHCTIKYSHIFSRWVNVVVFNRLKLDFFEVH